MHKMNMEEILIRLSQTLLKEMGRKNFTCTYFSDICGISRSEMVQIINRKRKDIKLSTIVKICENTDISYEDIFQSNIENKGEKIILDSPLIIEESLYAIKVSVKRVDREFS